MLFPLLYSATMLLVYSHIHIYSDKVEDLSVYKSLEQQLNEFGSKTEFLKDNSTTKNLVSKQQDLWKSIIGDNCPNSFTSHNQDVVKQLMIGFGFRVTGARYPPSQSGIISADYNDNDGRNIQTNTRSVLVTSSDPTGAKFIVTAIDPDIISASVSAAVDANNKHHDSTMYHHFDAKRVQDYFQAHNNRQGIAVLAFEVDDVQAILDRYRKLHPKLVADYSVYHDHNDNRHHGDDNKSKTVKTEVLEVYAYYKEHDNNGPKSDQISVPDTGTILRFVQVTREDENDVDKMQQSSNHFSPPLPGLIPVTAKFDGSSMPAYSVRVKEYLHMMFRPKR
jgi:hypothetical protein